MTKEITDEHATISDEMVIRTTTSKGSKTQKYTLKNIILDFTDVQKQTVDGLSDGGYATASVAISSSVQAVLIIAIYDKNNELTLVDFSESEYTENEFEITDITLKLPEHIEEHCLKVFLWTSLEDTIPLSKPTVSPSYD